MMRGDDTQSDDQTAVEALMLRIAAERNPSHFTEDELIDEVVTDRGDEQEVATARGAIACLREFGVASPRDDAIVELAPAVLRAVALLGQAGGHR